MHGNESDVVVPGRCKRLSPKPPVLLEPDVMLADTACKLKNTGASSGVNKTRSSTWPQTP